MASFAAIGVVDGTEAPLSQHSIIKIGSYETINWAKYYLAKETDLQSRAEARGFTGYVIREIARKENISC